MTRSLLAPCQRWRDGRGLFLMPGQHEEFDRRKYSVDFINETVAREFVNAHHYSRSYPAAVFRVGLFGVNAALEGVAVFSVPMNQRVIPAYTGLAASEGTELGRFVLLDAAPRNTETYLLGEAFKLLRRERPHLKAVVSYSDPVARRDASGMLMTPGHVGIIYQAHNGRYMGRGSPRTLHIGPDGRVLSPRTLSKIRLGESGWESAQRMLEQVGAPVRQFGEDGAEWVARVLNCGIFKTVRHAGNHCYAWAVAKGPRRRQLERGFRPGCPYPKQPDQDMELAA
ncbi:MULTISPECIES: hypothetical protein [unclassified Burkholderia]|uniref:Mom family adenine methylcarbamoylation protein n=1 Tax=unclassified Burkholderia TaxID=2613784 RepID=UPI002AB24D4E|nr:MULTISPECIES: hypothetical protein [unclassified Burkholderia]